MPRAQDMSIIGKTYNNLHVDCLTEERNSYGRRLYECTCLLCGEKRMATKQNLQKGEIKDCGNHWSYNDITGKRFGMLTALSLSNKKGTGKNRCKIWHCVCDCGKETDIPYNSLISGNARSCGCLQVLRVKELYIDGTAPCKLSGDAIRVTNTSGVTGVYFDKSRGKWCAEITFKKKKYYLGRYDNKDDAVQARKLAEEKIFGGFLDWYEKQKESGGGK